MTHSNRFRTALLAAGSLALAITLGSAARAADAVSITYLVDSNPDSVAVAQKQIEAFQAKNPDIHIDLDTKPGGGEGDNLIKTRLATGEMADVFAYNSGSLFHALNPAKNLVPLTGEPYVADLLPQYTPVVSEGGALYGVPVEPAMGGAMFYNKKIYADLGLKVPTTWDEFMANNAKIKAAGKVPVIQTFGTTWTSQLFFLGDFYNVLASNLDFATQYTENKAKIATTPAALAPFQHQADVFKAGDLNPDYASATLDDGIRMLAQGDGAHYPMLSFVIGTFAKTYGDTVANVGLFAIPGADAAKNGMTVWFPTSAYIAKTTQHLDAAKRFVAYLASPQACEVRTATLGVTGPFMVKSCALPSGAPPAAADLQAYFDRQGGTAPALEFLSPVKGPALEPITVEVGSGIRSPEEGAKLYDEDVRKQAQQLGLKGW